MPAIQVSVIIPTMNEEESIGQVLKEIVDALEASGYDYEVIVVDTQSKDRTVQIAEEFGARIIQEERRGYGRAYKTGFAEARGEFLATLDADLSYPGALVPRLVSRLEEEGLDFISCDRLTLLSREAMSPAHQLGNMVLNVTIRLLYRKKLRDSQSGMWVLRRSALEGLNIANDGMTFSEELKLEVMEAGRKFMEVPVHYRPRVGEPKLRSWGDGWANLRYLLERRFRSAPIASPPSKKA